MNKDRNSMENINIVIQIGQHKSGMSIPKQTKVSSLLTIVKGYESLHAQYAPLDTYFIGLASKNNNPLIDYWLTQKQLNFCRFYKTLQLKALYSIQKSVQKLTINNFQFLKCLGKGACGAVYLVRNKVTGYLFAMKRLLKESITDYKSWQTIMRQKQILSSFPLNQHTVTFHGSFESDNHFNLLLDYYPGGQLFLHLTSNQCKLSEKQAKIYFCQILLAMEFLHKQKILYRDLKPENILVDILGHLRITDFGLSKCGFQQEDIAYSQCGSPEYMAPQVLENKDYNFSADFYSIGAILYELLTGFPPYYGNQQDQQQKIHQMKKMDLNFSQFKSHALRKLLQHLLNPQPQHRLCNFQEIKNSPWLADIKWKQIQQKKDILKFSPDIYKSYIGQQFLQLYDEVQQMNITQNQGRKTYFQAIFNFVKEQSKQILLGDCPQHVQQITLKNLQLKEKTSFNLNTKRKTTDFVKEKQKLTKHKANYSIQLFDKEESTNSSHSTSTQNSNSSNLPYNPRTTRNQDVNKQNLMVFKKSYKILPNSQSSTNITGKLTKQPSQTNLIRPPSQQKILIKPSKTPIRLKTAHNTHNTSEYQVKEAKKQVTKQTTRKSDNFSSITKRQDRVLQKRYDRVLQKSQNKCKSKSKSKQKSQMKSIKLKQKPSSSIKLKKDLVPTCSYKIKLM